MDFILGALLTLLASLLIFSLTARKEKRQEVFRKELDRIIELEEYVGEVTEWVSGYQLSHDNPELEIRMNNLALKAGQFRRYPNLKQALRDLHNRAGILIMNRRENEDFKEAQEDLELKYREFISAIDEITGKRET